MDRSSRTAQQCEDRKAARVRLAALAEHRRVCHELEQVASLVRFYAEGRRLRAIPLGQYLEERWWAA
jgi:hypothetical protein